MLEQFQMINPVLQALIAGIFTWFCTLVGAATVFFVKKVDGSFLALMQGFAAGVMMAASFWSLLSPALEYAEISGGLPSWLPVSVGFIGGGIFLRILDKVIPHLHYAGDHGDTNLKNTKVSRTMMLFLAVTIHNIPEGLALGVAFAAANLGLHDATLAGAISLAIGIGIQNIPEGSALSLPLRAEGKSLNKSFTMAHMSAMVEPISAMIGAFAVIVITSLLPYALSFAAGAMIFVVVEELIPESQTQNNTDKATLGLMVGFIIMMILDVALG